MTLSMTGQEKCDLLIQTIV